jgi:hypothetical protein
MPTLQFYCSALNTLFSAEKATLGVFEALPTTGYDAEADVSVPLAHVENVFQFKPDFSNTSASGANKNDYRIVNNATPLSFDLNACTVSDNMIGDGAGLDLRIGYDWTRHLALKLFNLWQAAEYFENEEVATNLQTNFDTAFTATLTSEAEGKVAEREATVKSIFDQIAKADPERFGTDEGPVLPVYATGEVAGGWQRVPLKVGDKISFKLTVQPAAGQSAIVDTNPEIPDRTYLLTATITAPAAA